MKFIYTALIFFLPALSSAQTVKVKGRVIEEINTTVEFRREQPVPDLSLRIVHYGDCLTSDSGEFIIAVPEDVHQLEVEIKEDTTWILRYPKDPFPIPTDPNYITKIYVSKAAIRVNATREVTEGIPVHLSEELNEN